MRGLLTTTRCDEPALLIDELSDLSNDRIVGDELGPMTKRLSDLYAQRTAKESVQIVA
jgi:hypothetical protein